MLDGLRLLTLHPAAVHLPIGILVLSAALYVIAAARRSERWTFSADIAVAFGALTALLSAGLGLLSWYRLEWPGGLGDWPNLHLAFGSATVALSLGLAVYRFVRRRTVQVARWGAASVAVGLALVTLLTGWIGGEVLVFHSGIAVKGAAGGALAPSLTWAEGKPRGIHDAMWRLRGAWARVVTESASSVVEEPTPQRFREIEEAASHIQAVAQWLVEREKEDSSIALHTHGVGGAGQDAHGESVSDASGLQMSEHLVDDARALGSAARAQDIEDVMRAVGRVTQSCADCHQRFRWDPGD